MTWLFCGMCFVEAIVGRKAISAFFAVNRSLYYMTNGINHQKVTANVFLKSSNNVLAPKLYSGYTPINP